MECSFQGGVSSFFCVGHNNTIDTFLFHNISDNVPGEFFFPGGQSRTGSLDFVTWSLLLISFIVAS